MSTPLPNADLDWVLEQARENLTALRGDNIFITGGTGFVGSWLVECLLHANRVLDLDIALTVLSRDPDGFRTRFPHLAAVTSITLLQGDIRHLVHDGKRYDRVIHAATDASAQLNRDNPLLMADTIVEGTRRVLDFARDAQAKSVLMLSSGAVYGKFAEGLTHVPEEYTGAPDPLDTYFTYAESKRMAELLCAIYAKQFSMHIPVARLFAFTGPRLPLDAHFAAGNFIRDALNGGPIKIAGDGTAVRSYLYAAELVVWLLAILVRGQSGRAYNVGSDQAVSIRRLADTVGDLHLPHIAVEIAGHVDASNPVNYYVPDISRARDEIGLSVKISLSDSIARTLDWLKN